MSFFDIINDESIEDIKSKFFGVTVGVVTNIEDPEKLGRVKVKLLNRDTSDDETDFIRIVTPMSGSKWGMFFFPEVGDEVLVAFSNGNIERPYILGSLWNKNYKPPVDIKDKNDIRMIRTKSGHEIIFNDEEGKESIELKTPKELKLTLDDEKEIISIKDKDGKNIMKIDSKNGDITLEAEKKINIVSGNSTMEINGESKKVTIESNSLLKIKSKQIVIESKGTMELKASSSVMVKSDGPATIKGSMVKIN